MAKKLWLFEASLLSLKSFFGGCTSTHKMDFPRESFWVQMHNLPIACMNEDMGNRIRNTIGVVKNYDVQLDGLGWGTFLRTLIKIDIHKPITRGITLNVRGSKTWIPLTYEKLPKIYFQCG